MGVPQRKKLGIANVQNCLGELLLSNKSIKKIFEKSDEDYK